MVEFKYEMSTEKSELEKEVTCGVILMCVFNGSFFALL